MSSENAANSTKKARVPVEDWVNGWLIKHGAVLDIKTGVVYFGDDPNPIDLLISKLILAADRINYDPGVGKIKCALDIWRPTQITNARNAVIKQIAYDESLDDAAIVAFIHEVTGKKNNPTDVAVMKHFIWQIKRKLLRLKVGHHMMPIFFGKTNAGKTEAIKRFLSPIYELYKSPQDMTVIKDERSSRIMYDCYCIFFDEMARAGAIDVNRLKNTITSEDVSYRPMATNNVTTLVNNSTFIGATNSTLIETIYDPTSMRRFWQIETKPFLDRDIINSLPYLEMWKSVDPYQDSPIISQLPIIHAIQHNEFRNMFPLEDYLKNFCRPLPMEEYKNWLTSDRLYDNFKSWLAWQNLQKFTPTCHRFTRSFRNFKIKKEGEVTSYDFGGVIYQKKRDSGEVKYGIQPSKTAF